MREQEIVTQIQMEYDRAVSINKPFNSAHEGWAVIKEELDELWDEVRKNHKERNEKNMQKECVQIAAMAIRFINDLLNNHAPKAQD